MVERLAARPRRLERDRELLLDPLLADEVVEPPRPERAVELVLAPRRDDRREELRLAHAACLSASRTCSSTGRLGIDAGERSLGVGQRPAELDERVAGERAPPLAARGTASTTEPSFSFSSSTTRCAVFLPMPGIAWKRAVSSRAIARRSSAGVAPDTIASATFGPTPFAESSCEELALVGRRRSRRAGARPRGRGGTSRP